MQEEMERMRAASSSDALQTPPARIRKQTSPNSSATDSNSKHAAPAQRIVGKTTPKAAAKTSPKPSTDNDEDAEESEEEEMTVAAMFAD